MLLHNFQEPYQVIDTFGENDFVGVVLFNNNVETFRKFLVPMNGKNSGKLKAYIEKDYCETCHGGGTNFQESIRMAFAVMEDSKNSRASSFCARAIMFLTDGVADFYDDDYASSLIPAKLHSPFPEIFCSLPGGVHVGISLLL